MNQPDRPYIEFRAVWKSFGEQEVLKDVSFDVRRGETVVVLGRSGVGKSVTLYHIVGFLKPDQGQVFVDGEDVTVLSEEELSRIRRKVTIVFQSGALFDSLTIFENIAYPLRERQELSEEEIERRVTELLRTVELEEYAEQMPSELSTGMKRAVAIARALAAEPEAVLYDEPTTMVDPLMAQLVGDLIKKLKQQLRKTSVVVTHDVRLAKKLADRVVYLHDGRVAFFGTVEEMTQTRDRTLRAFQQQDELIPVLEEDS